MNARGITIAVIITCACIACSDAAHRDTSRRLLREHNGALAGVNRNLLQGGGRGGGGNTQGSQQRATNTLRSEIATADAIARAVNSGAVLGYNRMAAGVGVNTVFANTQGNKALFDQVEFNGRNGRKLHQRYNTPLAIETLRAESATADAIARATNSGARMYDTQRAARVGSNTVYAASQNDPALFDYVEFVSGKK